MPEAELLRNFYENVAPDAGYAPASARYYFPNLFRGVSLKDRRVLDIGGGRGLYSLYAACQGARVVCLEPVVDGSSTDMIDRFRRLQAKLPAAPVDFQQTMLQDYQASDHSFDVILMHNSINHLHESACILLREDESARAAYLEIFERIARLASPGAYLIASDCSPHNLFALLGLKNPIAPAIEWNKHQSPEVWASLLARVGFRDPSVTWGNRRRRVALLRLLLNNQVAAYLTDSYFCLHMRKA